MYHHLLVPIDDTDQSIEAVGNAVGLASALGARVTFCHVEADDTGSIRSESRVARQFACDGYAHAFASKAQELLAKAEAAAHAFGVPCDSAHVVSEQPVAAIIEAARARHCDLIFMVSHGPGGGPDTTQVSETLRGLMTAGLPVLVSATRDPMPPARAIGIIRDEHRSLAAVLHAWMHALSYARVEGVATEPALMQAIVRYLQTFPVALHHPKEEAYLFKRLRQRTRSVDAELDELERQHERDRQLVVELARQVETLASASMGGPTVIAALALEDAVRSYAAFLWEHLGREEGVILPAAQRYLTETDWSDIDAAFEENQDPRFGGVTDKEYRQLFSRIVNAASGWK